MMPPGPEQRPPRAPAPPTEATSLPARREAAHLLVAWYGVLAEKTVDQLADDPRRRLRHGTLAAATWSEQLADRLDSEITWCGHPDAGAAYWHVGHPTLMCGGCLRDTLTAATEHPGGARCSACGTQQVRNAAWLVLGPVAVVGLYCNACATATHTRPQVARRRTATAAQRIRRTLAAHLERLEPATLLAEQSRLIRQTETIAGDLIDARGVGRR